jgi:phage terminase small subunit
MLFGTFLGGQRPSHLSLEMRKFWDEVTKEYELECEAQLTLRAACENWDRAQQARELVNREGLVQDHKRHPAIDIEKQAYGLFLRSVRALGLDVIQPGPVGRPAGRKL